MTPEDFRTILADRMAQVEGRVSAACERAGRPRSEVTVVAVTKTLSIAGVKLVAEAGLGHLGESRPQELWKRAVEVPNVTWHFVGHLQRNKIDKTLGTAALIHSVDSLRLLEALNHEAGRQNRVTPILLEINASGESSKQGLEPQSILDIVPTLDRAPNLQIRGLMTMAAASANPEDCRPTFATLRKLRDKLRKRLAPSHEFNDLSMGMTGDFEIAIEEGATLVRLGSVYFEGLDL